MRRISDRLDDLIERASPPAGKVFNYVSAAGGQGPGQQPEKGIEQMKIGDKVLVSTATRVGSRVHGPTDQWVETPVLDILWMGYGENREVSSVYIDDGAGPRWVRRPFFREAK